MAASRTISFYRPGCSGRRKARPPTCYNLLFPHMPARVSLFVTCIVDQLFPKVGMAMAEVLERLGFRVDFPEAQTCCGQPAFNSGYREEARQVARHFLDVFRDADYIVVPSGSCTSMIAHHFEDIFRERAGVPGSARARLRPRCSSSRVF